MWTQQQYVQQQQQYQRQVASNKTTLILHHREEEIPLIVYRGTSEQAIHENIRELTNLYRFKCVNEQQQPIILSSNLPNDYHIYIIDPTIVKEEDDEEDSDEPTAEEQAEYLKTKLHQVSDAKNVLNVLKSMLIVLECAPPPPQPAEDGENKEEKTEDGDEAKPAEDEDANKEKAAETTEKKEDAPAATEDAQETTAVDEETKEETEDTQKDEETQEKEESKEENKEEEEDPTVVKYDGKYKELIEQMEGRIDVLQQIIFKSNDLSEDLLPKKAEIEEKKEENINVDIEETKEEESDDALLERLVAKLQPDLQTQILQMQQLLQMQQTTMMAMLAAGGGGGGGAAVPITAIDASASGLLGAAAAAGGTPLPRISFGLSSQKPQPLAQSQTDTAEETKEEKCVDRSSEWKQWFGASKLVEDDEYGTLVGFFPDKGKNIKSIERIYAGTEEQFDARTFHDKCDDAGATLCVIQSEHSHVFGGFTSKSWKDESPSKSGMWREDVDAFIYILRHPKDDVLPERWKILPDKKEKTIRCDQNYGPVFGYGYDIRICTECDQKKDSSSQLDNEDACFGAPQDDDFLTGEFYFLVKEYEVYKVTM